VYVQQFQNTIEVAKWDAKKQWQNKVEQLKNKVSEKDKQIEVLEKQVRCHCPIFL